MLKCAGENGMHDSDMDSLSMTVSDHVNIFRALLSAGPPAKVPSLNSELTQDAWRTRVRLRKYS